MKLTRSGRRAVALIGLVAAATAVCGGTAYAASGDGADGEGVAHCHFTSFPSFPLPISNQPISRHECQGTSGHHDSGDHDSGDHDSGTNAHGQDGQDGGNGTTGANGADDSYFGG